MLLVYVTAILAVCGAAKLDRHYLPPLTAKTSQGTLESLLAPVERSDLPTGSYVNEEQGVVVDAVAPGTRTSGLEPTGLGASRTSYGSIDSKVGEAAFSAPEITSSIGSRIAPGFSSIVGVKESIEGNNLRILPGIVAQKPSSNDISQVNTLNFNSENSKDKYSHVYQTENDAEKDVARDGIEANGGNSYHGDDGKVYSFGYTADKDGYKLKDSNLPISHPVPANIVKSLEDNAKDEAEGIVDDGSYDPQKYKWGYKSDNININKNNLPTNGDITVSSSILSGNNPTYQANSAAQVTNYEAAEHRTQSSNQHNAPIFGLKNNAEQVQGHFGTKSPYGSYNNGFLNPNKGYFLPNTVKNQFAVNADSSDISHVGHSFATAVASTDNEANYQKIKKIQGDQNQTPFSSEGNSAYSSAIATGSGSATAFASNIPIHPSFKNTYNPTASSNPRIGSFSPKADSSYYYNHPSQTFVIPASDDSLASIPINSLPQKPTNSLNIPTLNSVSSINSPQFGLDRGYTSTYSNSIRQKSITPATFNIATAPKPFGTQPQQFDTKAITQFSQSTLGQSQSGVIDSPLEHGTIYEYNKPIKYKETTYTTYNVLPVDSLSLSAQQKSMTSKGTASGFDNNQEYQGTLYQYNKPTGSIFSNKESSVSGSLTPSSTNSPHSASYTFSQSTFGSASGSQFGQKPQLSFGTNGKTDSSSVSQFRQPIGIKTTSFGQQPITTSQTTSSTFSQSTFGSTSESQFGQKPQSGFGTKGKTATQNRPDSQFVTKSQSAKQATNFGQKATDSSQTVGSNVRQTSFHSTSQFGQKSDVNAGATASANAQVKPISPFVSKPFDYQSTTGTVKSMEKQSYIASQFGQSSGSKGQSAQQFGQTTGIKGQSSQQSSSFGQQPVTTSQTTDSTFSQSTFGSTYGSQFGQKPQSDFGSKGKTATQNGTDSQFVTKSQTPSQFGQSSSFKSQSEQQFGQTTGQSSGAKGQSAQQFSQTIGTKGQSAQQSSSFGQKPTNFGQQSIGTSQTTSSTFSQNAYGSTIGSQFGQKPQTGFGTKGKTSAQTGPDSQFVTKSQTAQQASHFGQQAIGSKQIVGSNFRQNAFDTKSASQFVRKSDTGVGSTASATAQEKPISPFGSKPFDYQSTTGTVKSIEKQSYTASQFGQSSGSKGQSAQQFGQTIGIRGQSSQQSSSFGQQPVTTSQTTGSTFSQSAFGSTYGSQFGQKPQSGFGSKEKTATQNGPDSQFVTKSQTASQFGQSSSFKSQSEQQFGQTTGQSSGAKGQSAQQFSQTVGTKGQSSQQSSGFGQKPTSFGQQSIGTSQTTSSTFSQNAYGSTIGSQFGQKPQTGFGTKGKTSTQNGPDSQFVTKSQTAQQASHFGQQAIGSKQIVGSNFRQNAFDTKSASQFGRKSDTGVGTTASATAQVKPISPFVSKQFDYLSTTGPVKSIEKQSYTASQFGQSSGYKGQSAQQFGQTIGIKGQSSQQSSSFGQQPVTTSQTTGSTFSQSAFGSTYGSQFGQKPQSGFGSKGKTATQNGPDSQFVTKSQTASQIGQSSSFKSQSEQQFGQITGQSSGAKGQSAQQFSQTVGTKGQSSQQSSSFGQRPTSFGQQSVGTSQTTSPTFSQNAFGSTIGSQFGQKPETGFGTKGKTYTQNAPDSQFVTKSQTAQEATHFGQQATGSKQTVGSNFRQDAFDTKSASQFGRKSDTGIGSVASAIARAQTVAPFGSNLHGSQFTTGTLKSIVKQSYIAPQFSQSSGSKGQSEQQFGQTTGTKAQSLQQTTSFGQQPVTTSQTTGSTFSQSTFGSTSGSQFGQKPQSGFGTKGKTVTQNGPDSLFMMKTQTAQQATNFGQQSTGSSQTVGSNVRQTVFDTTSMSQFGQKSDVSAGATASANAQVKPNSPFFSKPFDSQSTTETVKTTEKQSYTASQFGQSSSSKGQSGQQFGQTIGTKGQSSQQSSSFGQKPTSFGQQSTSTSQTTSSTFSQSTSGSTSGSQFGQKPQSGFGTKGKTATQYGPDSKFVTKSQTVSQFAQSLGSKGHSEQQFGQTTGTKGQFLQQTTSFGQQPVTTSQTSGSTFSQSTFGSTYGSTFGQKPQSGSGTKGTTAAQNRPDSQFVTKSQTASQFGQSSGFKSQSDQQFVQTTGSKGQSLQQTNSFGQQPITTASQFGQSSGSKVQPGQKFGQTTGAKDQSSQKSTSFGQQTTSFGQQPISISQISSPALSQNTFGSTSGSQFGQKPQSGFGTKVEKSTQIGQAAGSIPALGSNFRQTTFNTKSASKLGQKSDTGVESFASATAPVQPVATFGSNSYGSQLRTGILKSTEKQSYTVTQFGQNAGSKSQSVQQLSNFNQKPLSHSQITGPFFTQTSFGNTPGSQFIQQPQSQSGTNTGVVPQVQPLSQKPSGSSVSEAFQSTQKGSSSVFKFGQTTGTKGLSSQQVFDHQRSSFGEQPLSSSQTASSTFPQNTFTTSGSQFGQTPQFDVGTKGKTIFPNQPDLLLGNFQSTQFDSSTDSKQDNELPNGQVSSSGLSHISQFETKINKLFVNTEPPFLSQYNYLSKQKPSSGASAFASSNLGSISDTTTDRVSKYQYTQFGKDNTQSVSPIVDSFRHNTYQQDLSSKFDVKPVNAFRLSPTLTFGHNQSIASTHSDVPSETDFNTQSQVIPSTQISIEELKSVVSQSKVAGTPTYTQKSSQSLWSLIDSEPLKPSNKLSFGLKSAQNSPKFASALSSVHALDSNVNNKGQPLNSFVGNKEVFGGPRQAPTFDVKTGYHY